MKQFGNRQGHGRNLALAIVIAAVTWCSTAAAQARQIRVCSQGCAYQQPADGLAAARDGDTVLLGPGVYAGGFAVGKNITMIGAGARQTTITGGGPVITIGKADAKTEPVVTLRALAITGGHTHSLQGMTYKADGGGIWIPPSAGGGVGATVTLSDSVIRGNTAAPSSSVDAGSGFPCSDTSNCQFAQAGGGGIDSWGNLTVIGSTISDNVAGGPVTSDADGAGIYGQQGTITVEHSQITRNRALVGPPAGRFAEGAGIMFDTFFSGGCAAPAPACRVEISDSIVSDNRSTLTSNLPAFAAGKLIGTGVNAGGIHVGDGIATTVVNSEIADNTASSINLTGEATAIDAAMLVGDSPLTMHNVRISGNATLNQIATSADIGPGGSTLELDGPGTLSGLSLVHNVSRETSPTGAAADTGALAVFNFNGDPQPVTISNSLIADNRAAAASSTGSATVQGAGVFNNSLLTLNGVAVLGNLATATAPSGSAQGGGIWNGIDLSGPPVELTLSHSSIVGNALVGTRGVTLVGGGIYTTAPVTLDHTLIALNRPNGCSGCALASPAARGARMAPVHTRRSPGRSSLRGRSSSWHGNRPAASVS